MKDKENEFSSKAAAAAKLVLQELDPGSKRKRQEFTTGFPQVILGIHVKHLKDFNKAYFFNSTFINSNEMRFFLQITVQNMTKCFKTSRIIKTSWNPKLRKVTHRLMKLRNRSIAPKKTAVNADTTPKIQSEHPSTGFVELTIDEMKMFTLNLNNKHEDPNNLVKFELIKGDAPTLSKKSHHVLAIGTLHMFDLMRAMYGTKLISIYVKERIVSRLEIEYVVRYGALGYGYSHQFKQESTSIIHLMNETMFFKVSVPPGRRDNDGFGFPCVFNKPKFIPYVYSNLEKSAEAEQIPMPNLFFQVQDTSYVSQLMRNRDRITRLRDEYLEFTTRHDRIEFLESLVAKPHLKGMKVFEPKHKYSIYSVDETDIDHLLSAKHEGRTLPINAVKEMVHNVSPLLLMATGVNQRARSGVVRKVSDNSEEDGAQNKESTHSLGSTQTGSSNVNDEINPLHSEITKLAAQKFKKFLKKKVFTPIRRRRRTNPEVEVVGSDLSAYNESQSSVNVDLSESSNKLEANNALLDLDLLPTLSEDKYTEESIAESNEDDSRLLSIFEDVAS